VYSRHSTFFCDCGAPEKDSESNSRSSCRCQTTLSPEQASKAFAVGTGRPLEENIKKHIAFSYASGLSVDVSSFIAFKAFPKKAGESLESVARGLGDDWPLLFLELIRDGLEVYRSSAVESTGDELCGTLSYSRLRRRLRHRDASGGIVQGDSTASLTPLATFRTGSFNGKISLDSSVDSLKRATLSRGSAYRSAMSSDSRGRLVIAEPNSLVVCSGLPILNPCAKIAPEAQVPRSVMNVHSKQTVDFNIIGVNHCPESDGHLVVWGFSEATVCVLNETRTTITEKINLELGLGSTEGSREFIVRCDWLPGSTSCLIARCVSSIYIFDVSKTTSPSAVIMVGSDSSFRGLVATEVLEEGADQIQSCWKVFLLMDDGHLHGFDLVKDVTGDIQVRNLKMEPKYSIKLPIGGVPVDGEGTTPFSLTLGEGIDLSFLQQSRLLLYQVVSESVLALQVDEKGKISSSFTLLPKEIPSEIVGAGTVTGPYTNWTELGAVRLGSSVYFRLVCIGRLSSRDPVLLCIDFNENETKVKELPLMVGSYGSPVTVEGVAAFSGPRIMIGDGASPSRIAFTENVAVVLLFSNGSIRIFCEEFGAPIFASSNGGIQCQSLPPSIVFDKTDSPPLLAFEGLTNASEKNLVVFEGDGIGR
jgi:hypothetical protein